MSAQVVSLPREARGEYTSLQFKVEAYQRATRCISPHCTASEFMVLMQILDRTVGWGVREISFTSNAARNGDAIYDGMSISRATWFRALAELEAKGIIRRRADARFPDKRHYSVNLEWEPDMPVPLPKRLKQGSHSETTPSQFETTPSHNETLYTGSPKTDNPETGNPGAPFRHAAPELEGKEPENPAASVTAKLEATKQAHQKARFEKVERGKKRGNASDIETVWRTAVAETFPGHPVPVWTVREKGQANTAAKKWRQPGVTFPDFIETVVCNWTAIMAKQFRWMTKSPPPAVPSTAFLYNFMDQFVDCYAEGKLTKWQNSKDRTKIEEAMARGLTYEQAVVEVAKVQATIDLREEMQKREAAAARKERAARIEVERAKRIADYGAAPVHPQSIEGLKRRQRRAPDAPHEDAPEIEPPLDLGENPYD